MSKKSTQTDWDRLANMTDDEIDTSDIPELNADFFKHATIRMPIKKKAVSIRLDEDVLTWYRAQGKGYQTRINAILRMAMEASIN